MANAIKKTKKAFAVLGCVCFFGGIAVASTCVNAWDFVAMPCAVIGVILGVACLDLVGAFDW